MRETERVKGKKDENYIDALKEYSVYLLSRIAYHDAYKTCLEAFELAKDLYGSELNNFSSNLLLNMAIAKRQLGQTEDMKHILERAKRIEETLNSKTSQKYLEIVEYEKSELKKD